MAGTREHLAVLINGKGVKITRGELWGALQRIPPAGKFATRMGAAPYAQALLLSILANRGCESCRRADNGGGHPCDCPVPCGARYCQHVAEDGSDERDPWAGDGYAVDADICDHLPVDPEVAAMAALAPALAALRRLKHDEAMRVMRWATDRATGNLPPF